MFSYSQGLVGENLAPICGGLFTKPRPQTFDVMADESRSSGPVASEITSRYVNQPKRESVLSYYTSKDNDDLRFLRNIVYQLRNSIAIQLFGSCNFIKPSDAVIESVKLSLEKPDDQFKYLELTKPMANALFELLLSSIITRRPLLTREVLIAMRTQNEGKNNINC